MFGTAARSGCESHYGQQPPEGTSSPAHLGDAVHIKIICKKKKQHEKITKALKCCYF